MKVIIKTLLWLAIALALATSALLVPAHLRSVDSAVLEYTGAQGPSPAESIQTELDAAHIGPAQFMAKATRPNPDFLEAQQVRKEELIALKPTYVYSGGPDPYFEAFLQIVQKDRSMPEASLNKGVLSILLASDARKALADQLSRSDNNNVTALLNIRDLKGLVQLHPASHAAGAPYDAGLLVLASLINGDHLPTPMAARIGRSAQDAAAGNPIAIHLIETLIINTLSIARQLDYQSLSILAQRSDDRKTWAQIAQLFRANPDRIATLYTALRFSNSIQQVYDYILEHQETAVLDLEFALRQGEDALRRLLESDQPIYESKGTLAPLINVLATHRPTELIRLTHLSNSAGLWTKFGILFLAGLAFSFSMGTAWRGSFRNREPVSVLNPAVWARDAFIGLTFIFVVWILAEPAVLKSKESVDDSSPRIEFAGTISLDSLQSPVRMIQELNQVTLLVLALFFVIQLVIYCFCLIKIREVSKQKLTAALKLKLLDNEELLFDFGLYVGLGGTVLSLILVAVGIVEASLMAAYASTLFGILFVALLKVLNLRPYRRRLILEAASGISPSSNADGTAALMRDIEL